MQRYCGPEGEAADGELWQRAPPAPKPGSTPTPGRDVPLSTSLHIHQSLV